MKLRFIIKALTVLSAIIGLTSSAQPTNQAWLNASRLRVGFAPAAVLGTNDPTALNWWILGKTNGSAIWLDPASVIASAGVGTVTSVGLTVPGIFSASGTPITTSGTLVISLATETANKVFAGPTSGGAATPTFRSLVSADIPSLSYVTSVGVSVPTGLSAGSAITSSGTIAITAANSYGFWRNDGGTTSWTLDMAINSLVLTNEQRIVETAWANGPTGAYDASVPLQTYAITAATAVSSLSNTRTATYANYSELNVTNSSGGNLDFTWSATGVKTPDGLRTYTMTNNQATTFKIETSAKGVWVFPIRHF